MFDSSLLTNLTTLNVTSSSYNPGTGTKENTRYVLSGSGVFSGMKNGSYTFRNCEFTASIGYTGTPVFNGGNGKGINLVFENCRFVDIDISHGNLITLSALDTCTFTDCVFENIVYGGLSNENVLIYSGANKSTTVTFDGTDLSGITSNSSEYGMVKISIAGAGTINIADSTLPENEKISDANSDINVSGNTVIGGTIEANNLHIAEGSNLTIVGDSTEIKASVECESGAAISIGDNVSIDNATFNCADDVTFIVSEQKKTEIQDKVGDVIIMSTVTILKINVSGTVFGSDGTGEYVYDSGTNAWWLGPVNGDVSFKLYYNTSMQKWKIASEDWGTPFNDHVLNVSSSNAADILGAKTWYSENGAGSAKTLTLTDSSGGGSAGSTSYTATGSGVSPAAALGNYVEDGTYNGYPKYTNGSYVMYYRGAGEWFIGISTSSQYWRCNNLTAPEGSYTRWSVMASGTITVSLNSGGQSDPEPPSGDYPNIVISNVDLFGGDLNGTYVYDQTTNKWWYGSVDGSMSAALYYNSNTGLWTMYHNDWGDFNAVTINTSSSDPTSLNGTKYWTYDASPISVTASVSGGQSDPDDDPSGSSAYAATGAIGSYTAANGEYSQSGTYNGKPTYTNGSYTLWYYSSAGDYYWVIGPSAGGTVYWRQSSSADTPPEGTYGAYWMPASSMGTITLSISSGGGDDNPKTPVYTVTAPSVPAIAGSYYLYGQDSSGNNVYHSMDDTTAIAAWAGGLWYIVPVAYVGEHESIAFINGYGYMGGGNPTPVGTYVVCGNGSGSISVGDYTSGGDPVTPELRLENSWTIDNGTTWHDSGDTITLDVGTYTVQFAEREGFATPASQTVTITENNNTSITATYVSSGE